MTLALWWKHASILKAKSKQSTSSSARYTQSEQALWKNLEKALNKNSAQDTQKYLPLWLGSYTQNKNASLAQSLKVIDNQDLNDAVNTLLASRYAKNQNVWQSTELQQILRKTRKNGSIENNQNNDLSPLYPSA